MNVTRVDPALGELLRTLVAAKHQLSFRCAYWVARAPGLERRIALAGMALEEEGHARVLEAYLSEDLAEPLVDRDALVTWETWPGRGDCPAIEQEPWPEALAAYAVQDAATTALLRVLRHADEPQLAQRAAKMVDEERFHELFATETLRQLAAGSPLQAYVRSLWASVLAADHSPALAAVTLLPADAAFRYRDDLRRLATQSL